MVNMFVLFTITLVSCASIIQAAPADISANDTAPVAPVIPAEAATSPKPVEIPSSPAPTEFSWDESPTTIRTRPTTEKITCHGRTPCGWAVYTPFIREIEQFITNRCSCPSHLFCTRDNDNYSMQAYVYRCTENYNADWAPENYEIH